MISSLVRSYLIPGIAFSGLFWLIGCGDQDATKKAEEQRALAEASEIAMPIETKTATGGTVTETLAVQGRLEVWRHEILSTEAAGIIRQIPALPDQPVKAGDLLLQLDPPLGEAEQLEKLTIAVERAQRARARLEKLTITAPVTVSKQDLEQALEASADAQRELTHLTEKSTKRRIIAPFAGVLVNFEGLVGSPIAEGAKFAELLDHSRYRIRLELPETTLRRLVVGQTVDVLALGDDSTATGIVASLPAAIDQEKGTGQVVIDTTSPPATWRPGGFATAKLVLKQTTGAVMLPRALIQYQESRAFCWLTETRDGHLVARRAFIEIGASDELNQIVTQGIQPGEAVISNGLSVISDGVRIVVKNESEKAQDKKDDITTDADESVE